MEIRHRSPVLESYDYTYDKNDNIISESIDNEICYGEVGMKKVVSILLLFLSLFALYVMLYLKLDVEGWVALFKFYNYKDWQTMCVEGCGTIKIPKDWMYYVKDEKFYVLDEENNPIMIETFSNNREPGSKLWIEDSNIFYSEIFYGGSINSVVIPNGVIYGNVLVKREGVKEGKIYLVLPKANVTVENMCGMNLIVWDKTLDMKTIEKIAWSFVTY